MATSNKHLLQRLQASKPIRRPLKREQIAWFVRHVIVVFLSIIFALPLLWALSTSLKSTEQVYVVPPEWIPNPVMWSNYPVALTKVPFISYIWNTLKIVFPSVIGAVASSAIVAYGFARIQWRYRDFFFMLCISTMIIPFQVTMIPLFIIFSKLKWVNTYLPLIVPTFAGVPYFIFVLRQFFLSIPQELSDAARVDGCSELMILTKIILPLSRPALAVVALFEFMWTWNDYLGPLLYLNREELFTVALGLSRYQGGGWSQASWSLLMAASVTSILPILVIFFFTQRTFIEGITLTGLKG
jgi:multiple sugar transport system permease protein